MPGLVPGIHDLRSWRTKAWMAGPSPAMTVRESNKLQGDAAERTEIGVQRVALLGVDHAREGTGENQMAGLERDAVLAELVGKPGDAERRMAEHAGGDAGLLDSRIAIHDAADPAQIDLERP